MKIIKTITMLAIVVTIIATMSINAFAFTQGFTELDNDSAIIWLPYYGTYVIETQYLPLDFNSKVNEPLLKFLEIYPYEVYAEEDNINFVQDEALSLDQGYYALKIFEVENITLNDTNYTILDFAVIEYDAYGYESGVIYEPDILYTPTAMVPTYMYVRQILSEPESVSEFFQYMMPILPIMWPEYSKTVVGDYNFGYQDGIAKGRQLINITAVNDAYERGKLQGKDEGYAEGYDDGSRDSNKYTFRALVDAVIFEPVHQIISNLKIDVFGVSLGNLLVGVFSILIVVGLITIIVRFFF